jgi:protein-S-isoprenylcysteine O-methyltransferase Ste14
MSAVGQSARDPRKFPFPPAIPIVALLLSWGAGRLWPIDVNWPAWSQWIGWALVIAACGLALSAVRTFRRHRTTVNPLARATTIVASGPFRYTRNPMYVSLLALHVGGMLAFRLPWAAILLVPVFLALNFGVIAPEEKYLASEFGEPYRLYQQRVRRWL